MPEGQSSGAKRDMSSLYVPASIIIAGIIIAIGLVVALSPKSAAQGQGAAAAAPVAVDIKNVKIEGEPFIGKADAPVTMAFWSDYQCPFCKAVEVGGVPQIPVDPSIPTLIKNYVDTGKLKIVFKDFAFLGKDSITGAEYARAIWDLYPDKYYTWREAMFKAQDQEGDQGFGNAATIDQLIKTIPGIDDAKVKAQIAANKDKYDAAISADTQEGESMGVSGTPGFITGTKLIDGAQPLSAFTAVIDPQLQ